MHKFQKFVTYDFKTLIEFYFNEKKNNNKLFIIYFNHKFVFKFFSFMILKNNEIPRKKYCIAKLYGHE